MFIWAGICFMITLVAAFFAFAKNLTSRPIIQKIAKAIFWISLVVFLIFFVICIIYIRNLIAEGMREKWLVKP